jgi:hypothetical protein
MPLRNALRLIASVLVACLLQRVREPHATPAQLHTLFALAVLALCADAVVYKNQPFARLLLLSPHAAAQAAGEGGR